MKTSTLILTAAFALTGCGVANSDVSLDEGTELGAVDETAEVTGELSSAVPNGATLRTTANLNLRSSASTSASVRLVIPNGATVTAVNGTPSGGWYNIKYNGTTGWSFGPYLSLVSSGGGTTTPPPNSSVRDAAISRAKSGVGFSYWWGHGRWIPNGLTSSNSGYCSGSCPNCSHSGSYGADCSGYVAKIWQVPSSNTDMTDDSHPYSTLSFIGSNSQWVTISKGAAQKGDALVYNTNGAGHMFIFESGDGWGSMWAYEAKGCSYKIVHNLRTAGAAYKAIKRAGW